MFSLEGQGSLICGAEQGIGLANAKQDAIFKNMYKVKQ